MEATHVAGDINEQAPQGGALAHGEEAAHLSRGDAPHVAVGQELEGAATYGGAGWVDRGLDHRAEVQGGRIWRTVGGQTEVGRLREVLISWPSDSLHDLDDPDRWLLLERVDLARLRRQAQGLQACYESLGVTVHVDRAPEAPPNYLFMRDLFFTCDEGAVLGRSAAPARAGEERLAARALAELGVPILHTTRGTAFFEGADALWVDAQTVLVGLGRRTNREGLEQLSRVLAPMGVRCLPIELPGGTQHLLGVVAFADRDLALMRADRDSPALVQLLEGRGYQILRLPATPEITHTLAMNIVCVSPREVVMPAGAPATRRLLEAAGVRCHEVEIGEYARAAGGPGCATGILRRDRS